MGNGNMSSIFAELASSVRFEVRASHFGLCAKSPALADRWICSRSATAIAAIIAEGGNSSANWIGGDPLNLVYMASKFRTDVVFVGLQFISIILAAVLILCLTTFPIWYEEEDSEHSGRLVRAVPSSAVINLAVTGAFFAFILGLLSSFWQHLSSSATATVYETATYGVARAQVGASAAALAWTSVLCQALVLMGLIATKATLSLVMRNV
ncbi:hypothetical protein PWT90_08177 [Aphanocladium album]|nr:hypothetical protein PWT90_08177 [Aphanocladium album]